MAAPNTERVSEKATSVLCPKGEEISPVVTSHHSTAQCDTLLLIPTYNEAGNIRRLLQEIQGEGLDVDFLVIDDNSPDGTGAVVDALAREMPLQVIHRPAKLGIGSAHRQGFQYAITHHYGYVMTMDADFAHQPAYLRTMLAQAPAADVVVASRYLDGGGLRRWGMLRLMITHTAHWLTRHVLRLPYDCTGGFRLYRTSALQKIDFTRIRSEGYAFLIELLFYLNQHKCSIREVPIVITARHTGVSKISRVEILNAVKALIRLRLHRRSPSRVPIDWDEYWLKAREKHRRGLYEHIAAFYRRFIIAPMAGLIISRYFVNEPGHDYLHAGCGSGGSDQRINLDRPRFHSLDLSFTALTIHREQPSATHRTFVCGNLFTLPYQSESIDGIFNFGVMEHFVELDIESILSEFRRVLKREGKVILFWPPNFGLSVIVLSSWLWLVNLFRQQPLSLYPDEVSRVRSFRWVRALMAQNGFIVLKTHFGPQDLFTFVVVIAQKA